MTKVKTAMMKAAMTGLYRTGAHRLLAPYTQGLGVIFTLHHVRPEQTAPRPFSPNRILDVTPAFLEAVINQVREAGLDIIDLDEAAGRLREGNDRRFACFTFDDGYRDNLVHAHPILKRHAVPYTLYVPTTYADGRGELWWDALEQVIATSPRELTLRRGGEMWTLPTATDADKENSFEEAYWWLRGLNEESQRLTVRALAEAHHIDLDAECRKEVMDWNEIRELAADPLVTIGAHTKDHYAIAKLPAEAAMEQMTGSADRIEQELGVRPRHFAFPYGDPASAGARDFALAEKAGFETAVTTRKGMLFADHKDHLTALPRVSLNGDYQSLMYTALYLSGAPFALWNGFQQVNAA